MALRLSRQRQSSRTLRRSGRRRRRGRHWSRWRYFAQRESTDDAEVDGAREPGRDARRPDRFSPSTSQDNQTVKAGDVLVEIDPQRLSRSRSHAPRPIWPRRRPPRARRARACRSRRRTRTASSTSRTRARTTPKPPSKAPSARSTRPKPSWRRPRRIWRRPKANATRARAGPRAAPAARREERDPAPAVRRGRGDRRGRAARPSTRRRPPSREAQANLNVSASKRTQAVRAGSTQAQAQAKAADTAPQQIALTEAAGRRRRCARCCRRRRRVDQAKVNLDRTVVRAPADGIVSAHSLEVGQIVQVGQPLLQITSLDDVWVHANFKETQLDADAAGPVGRSLGGRV